MKILIYSPVHLDAETFEVTSSTWRNQEVEAGAVTLCVHDEGFDEGTSRLIRRMPDAHILQSDDEGGKVDYRDQWTHRWSSQQVDRVIKMKNEVLSYFREEEYDFLLLVDSDLCLHPRLLDHLVSLDLDVVCEVFWTRFRPLEPYLPNVWDYHEHTYSSPESIYRLKEPGLYVVGGMGACTLIKRAVVLSGVTFNRVHGVSYWSEDPHFCIRLASHDYTLHVDTSFPAFHVYRRGMLEEAQKWVDSGCPQDYFRNLWLNEDWEKEVASHLSSLIGQRGMMDHLVRRWSQVRIAVRRKILIEGLRSKFL